MLAAARLAREEEAFPFLTIGFFDDADARAVEVEEEA